jgi:phosphate/sulfate permease
MMSAFDSHITLHLHWRHVVRDLPFATLYCAVGAIMIIGLIAAATTRPHALWSWQALTCALMGPTLFLMGATLFYDLYQWLTDKPAMTFTERGILIDAGPFDRHYIAWQDIEAMSCSILQEHRDIYVNIVGLSETFVCTSIRRRDGRRRRMPSRIAHSFLPGHYDFCHELQPLELGELERLRELVSRKVSDIEPMLVCDWE